MPAITVLMAVHNGEAFLGQTLDSVAAQSFTDYEFLIVDDASSDATASILARAADRDERIRVITNDANLGLTRSLNRGLSEACADFIARIDADDVCLPHRLMTQYDHMQAHRHEVGIVANYEMTDGQGRTLGSRTEALDDWQVRWLLGWNPPGPHPTFFFKRCPDGVTPIRYDENFKTAQDFELWSRLAAFGPTQRLADVLVQYRRHEGAITHFKRYEQAQNCASIGRANLAARLPGDVLAQLDPLLAMFSYDLPSNAQNIRAAVKGADAMVRHDCANAPSTLHAKWVRKMVAGLLADAALSRGGGFSSPKALAAFMWHARAHLPHLAKAILGDPSTALKALRQKVR